jgi:hypothetical protein
MILSRGHLFSHSIFYGGVGCHISILEGREAWNEVGGDKFVGETWYQERMLWGNHSFDWG